eukprot:365509-Chlamydomonas_euryale.AAC.36
MPSHVDRRAQAHSWHQNCLVMQENTCAGHFECAGWHMPCFHSPVATQLLSWGEGDATRQAHVQTGGRREHDRNPSRQAPEHWHATCCIMEHV